MIKCVALTKIHGIVALNPITRVFLDRGRPLKAGAVGTEFIYTILERDIQLCGRSLCSVPEAGRFQAPSQKGSAVYSFPGSKNDSEMLVCNRNSSICPQIAVRLLADV